MRIAVSFLMGGSPLAITFPLLTLEGSLPIPMISYGIVCSLCLLIHRLKIRLSPYPLHYSPSPNMNALAVFHTQLNSTCIFALPFRFSPSKQFPPLHWDRDSRLNSRNGISNNNSSHANRSLQIQMNARKPNSLLSSAVFWSFRLKFGYFRPESVETSRRQFERLVFILAASFSLSFMK